MCDYSQNLLLGSVFFTKSGITNISISQAPDQTRQLSI
jgi:hypothetical protein